MFDTGEKSMGAQYTMTAALLLPAFVFMPALLLLTRPVGYVAITVGIGCSAVFLALSRLSWTRYSRLTIAAARGRAK